MMVDSFDSDIHNLNPECFEFRSCHLVRVLQKDYQKRVCHTMVTISQNDSTGASFEPFPITTSLSDAAREVLKQSFAVYKVPSRTAKKIQVSWCEAVQVLNDPAPSDCRRIIDGNLHGYNVPSSSKRLFRAFCAVPGQPWPNEKFRKASINVATELHQILVQCCSLIEKNLILQSSKKRLHSSHSSTQPKSTSPSTEQEDFQPLRKRQKVSSYSGSRFESIPPTIYDTTISPLDFFFYHNKNSSSVNCSEHVDRGVLICVCLTKIPGLEVSPRGSEDFGSRVFVCPEVLVHNANLYKESDSCSDLICIMAGDQLSKLTGYQIACVHKVRNNLKSARLSISYELRV